MNDKYLNWCLRGYLKLPAPYDYSGTKGNLKIIPMEYKNLDSLNKGSYRGFILQENLDYLDSIVQLSSKINSKLIIVVSPTYIAGTKRIINFSEHIAHFSNFANSRSIPFMDYSADTMCSQKKWFADFYHLKPEGCDAFSLKFSNDFKRKFLKQ